MGSFHLYERGAARKRIQSSGIFPPSNSASDRERRGIARGFWERGPHAGTVPDLAERAQAAEEDVIAMQVAQRLRLVVVDGARRDPLRGRELVWLTAWKNRNSTTSRWRQGRRPTAARQVRQALEQTRVHSRDRDRRPRSGAQGHTATRGTRAVRRTTRPIPQARRIRASAPPKSDTAQRPVSRRSSVSNESDRPVSDGRLSSLQSVLVVEHRGVRDPDDRALR